jgi:protein SCO1/2
MNANKSRLILVISAFLGGLVVFLGVILFVSGHGPSIGGGSISAIGGPFDLIDQNGKPITDRDMKGKPFLVFFGYTHCPDVCPTTLFETSEVMRALGKDADRTAMLFVSVDPDRDTPPVLKDYLSSFDPHLRGVTGTADGLAKIEREYRVYSKKIPEKNGEYSMDHSAVVYLMDKDGHFVAPFNLKRRPEASADDLRKYM